ncbi:MAG: DUF2933 domain-containing protein [Acidimicrobiales bacterium]
MIAGLAVAAAAIYLFAPNLFAPNLFGAALPLLIVAACPLSMLLMMRMMSGSGNASCSTTPSQTSGDAELAQLRAEVERLRAEQQGVARPTSAASEPR